MVTTQSPAEQRTILSHVSWETYECLLRDYEERSAPRFTYDRGVLEIMSPLVVHEAYCSFFDCLLAAWADETDTPVRSTGATTYRRQDLQRGFEPDASYYVLNEPSVRGKAKLDLNSDPPPDLIIEIDITHSSIDKLPIYAQIAVPEVWRYDGDQLQILLLHGEGYSASAVSRVIPTMTHEALSALLQGVAEQDMATWLRRARTWARNHPNPR